MKALNSDLEQTMLMMPGFIAEYFIFAAIFLQLVLLLFLLAFVLMALSCGCAQQAFVVLPTNWRFLDHLASGAAPGEAHSPQWPSDLTATSHRLKFWASDHASIGSGVSKRPLPW